MNTTISTYRKPEAPVHDMFVQRWSPRAMRPEPLTREELLPLFEAARWAPSSYNNQPWRFLYALRGTPSWETYLGLLVPNNRAWAKNAGALIVIASHKNFDATGKPSQTHHYDAGAAWAYFALQGSLRGLVVHGMEGFDYQRARTELGIPGDFDVEAMAAVGHPGLKEELPPPARAMEKPSGRKKLAEISFEGRFQALAEKTYTGDAWPSSSSGARSPKCRTRSSTSRTASSPWRRSMACTASRARTRERCTCAAILPIRWSRPSSPISP